MALCSAHEGTSPRKMTRSSATSTFLTKVYAGPFRNAPHWALDMERHAVAKGRAIKKLYFGYTTCPRCAEAYGKNYVVLFAQVK